MGDEKEKQESSKELAEEAMDSGELPEGARKRYVVSVFVMAISVSFGSILLKYGLSKTKFPQMRSFGDIYQAGVNALSNPWIDLGIILLIANFVALGHALRYGPLSLTAPLRSAAGFVGTPILAVVFLGEHINLMHWVGILAITADSILMGISGEKG